MISPEIHRAAFRKALWMLLAGVGIAGLGYLPLQLYIWFGPADGNPIGLGLLMIVAVPVGLILAGFGALQWLIAWLLRTRT